MKRQIIVMLPVFVVIGGLLLQKFEFAWDKDGFHLKNRAPQAAPPPLSTLPPVRAGDTIRIATFNIQVFGEHKLADMRTADVLTRIIRKFDIVAIQEIRAKDPNFMARFLQMVNAGGFHYDCVVGPRLGRTDSKEQYAYIFDLARVEVDRSNQGVYTVDDPDKLLHRPPLVAGFRARGAPPQEAFTFSLVNIHTDPDEVADELDALDDVFRAVRNDGRNEDDVLLLGDFNTRSSHPEAIPDFGQLGAVSYLDYIAVGVRTNTRLTETYDNILFDRRATTEFDRSKNACGVLDVMREFNITLEQALLVSDHLPVWAEFSVYEGGSPTGIAANPQPAAVR